MEYNSRKVCHFFPLNCCRNGDSCRFLHELKAPLGQSPNGNTHNEISEEHYNDFENPISVQDQQALNQNIIKLNENYDRLSKILKEIIPHQQIIQAKLDLDLMFIVDCTGSMGAWIDAIKKELSTIIAHIQNEFQLSDIRVSFVGYRDFSDEKKQFSIHDFTNDIEEIKKFIGKQKAIGGGDLAEDVIGGLSHGLQQSWKSKARYAVLICDAPSHGSCYYKGKIDDKFPAGDPQGRKLEDLIAQFAKNSIIFYAIRINEITDKMFTILAEAYMKECGRNIVIANLGNSTKSLGFFLVSSISNSVSQTSLIEDFKGYKEILNNLKLSEFEKKVESISSISFDKIDIESEYIESGNKIKENTEVLSFEIDSSSPDWNGLHHKPNLQAICHNWFIVKDKNISINWSKPLIQKSQISTTICMNEKPFSSGSMRWAFYMKDLDLNQKLVGKIPKTLDKNYNLDIMMKDIESLFICNHIINEFNDRIISLVPDENMVMSFVHGFVYEIKDEKLPLKYWWVENYIEGTYEKFNNNAGWESKNIQNTSLIAHCLSHFSWQYTQGYLMIVDLQGSCGTLTDPQIHCGDRMRFGKGNLGILGIVQFFLTHNCNFYCEKLGLVNPKNNKKMNDFKKNLREFLDNRLKMPINKEMINKLCDLCRKPYRISSEDYYLYRKTFPEIYCKNCQFEKEKEMKENICCEPDCKKIFKYSVFWFKMKRTDAPIRCSNCRLKNRNKLRNELEQN